MPINNWDHDIFFNNRVNIKKLEYITEFDKKIINQVTDININSYQLKNLKVAFPGNNHEKLNIFGNIFIISLDLIMSHFHFLQNQVAQFLVLKKTFPDLKALVVMYGHDEYKKELKDQNRLSQYCYSILSKLDVYDNSILYIDKYKEITIENYFVLDPNYNIFSNDWQLGEINDCPPWFVSHELIKLVKPNHDHEDKIKIFMSRIPENSKTRKQVRSLNKKIIAGKITEEEFFAKNDEVTKTRFKHRFISFEDETMLEKFFKSKGYKIINPGAYSFEDQIKFFEKASHIAGLSGAGFINTIFSPTGANVFILNTSSGYDFDHGHFPRAAGHRVFYLPKIFAAEDQHVKLTGEDIINELEKLSEFL